MSLRSLCGETVLLLGSGGTGNNADVGGRVAYGVRGEHGSSAQRLPVRGVPSSVSFAERIEAVAALNEPGSLEFAARLGLTFVPCLLGAVLADFYELLVWYAAFLVATFVEHILIQRLRGRDTAGALVIALGLNFGVASVAAFLPVFLWQLDWPPAQFGALAAILGMLLHILSQRSVDRVLLAADTVPMGGALALMALHSAGGGGQGVVLVLVSVVVGISVYFWISVGHMISERRLYDETRARAETLARTEALVQLTGGFAHEFNNLLSAILGNLEDIRAEPDPGERGQAVDRATRAVDRGAALTRQLLEYAGRAPLNLTEIDPGPVIEQAATRARAEFGDRFPIRVEGGLGKVHVRGDAMHLEAALLGLLSNAREASGSGGPIHITTSARRVTRPIPCATGRMIPLGVYVQIEVRDEGAGMTEEVLSRAVEPFFSTKPVGQGTGLGLASVMGFVEQSQGYAELRSVPGEGTSVRLLFVPVEAPSP